MNEEQTQTEKKPEIVGLKRLRKLNEDGSRKERRPEWNKPNPKAAANLKRRQEAHEKLMNDRTTSEDIKKCHHRPGSMKIPR